VDIASLLRFSASNKPSVPSTPTTTPHDLLPSRVGPLPTVPTLVPSNQRSITPHVPDQPVKKQSKWSPEEDAVIIELRGRGMKWEDVSKRLPGRSAMSCRLHYQNYLERRSEWDEECKNELDRLYDSEITEKKLPLYDIAATQMGNFVSATDSGYASLPIHDYKGSVQDIKKHENMRLLSNESHINYTTLLDNEDRSANDTGSVYTEAYNILPSKRDAYISSLADDLLNKTLTEKLGGESLDRIREALPRHLKTFAMRMGSSNSASIYCDVMVFVRKYRRLRDIIFQLSSLRC
jgi:hypothetical protein